MKKILAILCVSAVLLCSAGCNNSEEGSGVISDDPNSTDNTSSSAEGSDDAIVSTGGGDNSSPSDPEAELIKSEAARDYNIELPIVTAGEALNMFRLDPKIDGHDYSVNAFLDWKTLLVSLFDRVGAGGVDRGIGLYDLESYKFSPLPGLAENAFCAWDSNYIVYKKYDSDFTIPAEDESVRLYLYDINAEKEKLIYTYSFDRDIEFYGGHWQNNIVLSEGKVFFDDYIVSEDGSEMRSFLYSYDIASDKVEKLVDDAVNPHLFKNDILYFKQNEDGRFKTLVTLGGDYETAAADGLVEIVTFDDRIFIMDAFSDDEAKITVWGIKDLVSDKRILQTEKTITSLQGSGSFLVYWDFSANYPPLVYDVANERFIVFDELIGNDVGWYICGEVGLARASSGGQAETYLFTLK